MICTNEKVLADHGYSGSKVTNYSLVSDNGGSSASAYRAHHESANGVLKMFNTLHSLLRHGIEEQNYCIFTVANTLWIEIENR